MTAAGDSTTHTEVAPVLPPTPAQHARRAPRRINPVLTTWAARLGPPLVYLLLALYYFWGFLSDLGAQIPGDADGVIYAWFFQSIEQSVVHLHNPLFTTAMNAPDGVNLMWNTSLVALGVVCVPLTAAIGAVNTTVLMMMLAPVVSASCAYYALRRITGSAWGSALAATLYGFGPFFVGQNGHLHLTFAFLPPLLLLVGYELLVTQHRSPVRTGVKLGILVGLGLLVSEEIVALAAIISVLAVVVLAAVHPRQVRSRLRYAAHGTGVGALIALAIAGYPLWYQFFGRQSLSHGPTSQQRLDLAGIVRPSQLQYYASHASIEANRFFSAIPVENTGYLGWPLVILIAAICVWLIRNVDRFGWWWLVTALLTVALSLGDPIMLNGVQMARGPWSLLAELPLAETVVAVRFTLLTTLLVALLLAHILAAARGRVLLVLSVVVIAALVPMRPFGQYQAILRITTPRFFTSSAVDAIAPNSTVLLLPRSTQDVNQQAAGMMWQIRANQRFKIIDGYSVFSIDGQMSYLAADKNFARLLEAVGQTGRLPSAYDIAVARPSVAGSGTRYIVLSDEQPNRAAVQQTAQQLTGCVFRQVADIQLCEIPET
jgi:hypothetical protein